MQNITMTLKEVKPKAPIETFNLIAVQVGYSMAKSSGRCGILRLRADVPVKNTGKTWYNG